VSSPETLLGREPLLKHFQFDRTLTVPFDFVSLPNGIAAVIFP
jgi:hypothetical protein